MAKTIEPKPEELQARTYADQLIVRELSKLDGALKLSDIADTLNPDGLGLGAIKSLLATNPDLFVYHERRWIPKARLESYGRPVAEIVRSVVQGYLAPMPYATLIEEIQRIWEYGTVFDEGVIQRLLNKDSRFVQDPHGRVMLAKWGFDATDEETDRALEINGVSKDDFVALKAKLAGHDWKPAGAVSKAIASHAPTSLRLLGAVAWDALNGQDPRAIHMYDNGAFLSEALNTPGFVYVADGTIHPESAVKNWIGIATKLADKLAPTVSIEDAQPIEVKPEDVGKLVDRIKNSPNSVTATKILEDVYEITPTSKTFPDDLSNVMDVLKSESSINWVGGDRFRAAIDVPDFYHAVPDPFFFPATDVLNEEGEPVDIELLDDGLNSSLRKLLSHPLATDVLDEDIQPAPKQMPETLRLVLKSIHRELGTFPLCQIPTNWLDGKPNLQELIFIDPAGRELQVWANLEARLMYNLIDWWFEQATESGAVFTLTKTNRPNVFEFAWLDQPDPVVYISTQRMEQLRNIGEQFDGRSTLDVLIEVFNQWPKGADFLTLQAEVNVARRSSRRLIASLLSSYQCFYQRSGSPVWHFDAKKVEQGFDKSKKKYIKN